jgi:hypothetical protein
MRTPACHEGTTGYSPLTSTPQTHASLHSLPPSLQPMWYSCLSCMYLRAVLGATACTPTPRNPERVPPSHPCYHPPPGPCGAAATGCTSLPLNPSHACLRHTPPSSPWFTWCGCLSCTCMLLHAVLGATGCPQTPTHNPHQQHASYFSTRHPLPHPCGTVACPAQAWP